MAGIGCDDTIAAVATAAGQGAVGIVRVSGPEAVAIVDKVFCARSRRPLGAQPSFTVRLGWIVPDAVRARQTAGRPAGAVDEVLVSVMRAPRSYTREDVVEVSAHGGLRAVAAILDLILAGGARLAEPGEFTRRAFLNGRLDLAQAEAVLDVIRAKGERALKNSERQLAGELSRLFGDLRAGLLGILADMEAVVDFPEEETRSSDAAPFARALAGMARTLDLHLERAPQARMMREGVATVIYGRPNVGKSSLLNALLRRERAIVTAVPGTTRDTVEEEVQRGGTTFRLIDTAGIVAARDAVEEEALARSRQAVAAADIVLFVLDGAAPLEEADRRLFASLEEKRRLLLVNKSDLPEAWPRTAVHGWTRRPVFEVSARTGAGIPALEGALVESVFDGPPAAEETVWVTDTRHIEALRRGREALGRACASLEEGLPLDVAALDVRACAESIGVVTGAVCTQEILDAIFSKFCIGK